MVENIYAAAMGSTLLTANMLTRAFVLLFLHPFESPQIEAVRLIPFPERTSAVIHVRRARRCCSEIYWLLCQLICLCCSGL